ncbi:uncharacterized protein LOC128557162 isoform X2 [Mercenaria mercenaria]|uniref:uncharacterized protein LOC128557162 isoform X2 n=1 Tax=Mercenaria mercenaria TaxID=6596 RepID=UPI00234FA80F|nr:uncharacterized protein LOC128557162 isoform X2 [Mercenaria mercenaria]
MLPARKNTESNKEKFSNWIHCVISVSTTKTAFVNSVIRKWRKEISTWKTDEQNQLIQFLHDVGADKVNESTGGLSKWSMSCHPLCNEILQHLVKLQRNPKRKINWNSCLLSLEIQIWCLANMFLLPGTTSTKGPADTDASTFFQMMNNCELFKIDDGDRLYEEMLEVRTRIHHSATYLLNKDETRKYLKVMTDLLEAFDEPECKTAVKQIREMEDQLIMMVSVPDETFKKMAENALDLQKNFLHTAIDYNKNKGLTTDDLEVKLDETDMARKTMTGSPSRFGLKSRREYKNENQEYREKLEQMKSLASKMEELKTLSSKFKDQIQKIDEETTPEEAGCSENLVDLLLKRVSSISNQDAKEILVSLCKSIPKEMQCMKMDSTNSCVCGKCTCRK